MRGSHLERARLAGYRRGINQLSEEAVNRLKPPPFGTCATQAFQDAGHNNIKFEPDIPFNRLIERCNQLGFTIRHPNPKSDTKGVPLIAIYRVGHPDQHQLHAEYTNNVPGLLMEGKQVIEIIETDRH